MPDDEDTDPDCLAGLVRKSLDHLTAEVLAFGHRLAMLERQVERINARLTLGGTPDVPPPEPQPGE